MTEQQIIEAIELLQRQVGGLKFLLGLLALAFAAFALWTIMRRKRYLMIERKSKND